MTDKNAPRVAKRAAAAAANGTLIPCAACGRLFAQDWRRGRCCSSTCAVLSRSKKPDPT